QQIEGVNRSISKVANQQAVAEHAKVRRRQHHSPWCVQKPSVLKPLHQPSMRIENRNKAQPRSIHFVNAPSFLLGESNYKIPADVLDVEWRIAEWNPGIAERPPIQMHGIP